MFHQCAQEWLRHDTWEGLIFQTLCQRIAHEMHGCIVPEHVGTREHMIETWDAMQNLGVMAGQRLRPHASIWFHMNRKGRIVTLVWTATLGPLLYAGITLGWWTSIDDTPLFGLYEYVLEDAYGPIAPDEGDAGATASTAIVAWAAVAPPPRAVMTSNVSLEKKRGECHNSVHLTAEILCNYRTRAFFVAKDFFVAPIESAHSAAILAMKTARGCRRTAHARRLPILCERHPSKRGVCLSSVTLYPGTDP